MSQIKFKFLLWQINKKLKFASAILFAQCESSSGVEHHLAKVRVAGSNPVFRSISTIIYLTLLRSDGGIGRHVGLKIQ